MHITGENTVHSCFLGILLVKTRKKVLHGTFYVFLCNITGENTVKSNACVHLVVFCAYYW